MTITMKLTMKIKMINVAKVMTITMKLKMEIKMIIVAKVMAITMAMTFEGAHLSLLNNPAELEEDVLHLLLHDLSIRVLVVQLEQPGQLFVN